jgi:hypothetical protein
MLPRLHNLPGESGVLVALAESGSPDSGLLEMTPVLNPDP